MTKTPTPSRQFRDLGLPDHLLAAVARLGYTDPTPIQTAAIPALLSGEDIVGIAQTGTGKTAAFGLPMLAGLVPDLRQPQGLVLVPTRELALQVATAIEDFAGDTDVDVAIIYGGASYYPQLKALEAGADIVVGTPGRLIDLLKRGRLDLSAVRFVVLDEGDEMLKMGFAEEVDEILAAVPAEHQTALFSATMAPELRQTVATHLRAPRQIAVTRQASTVDGVDQYYAVAPHRHKIGALARVLATSPAEAALVFVATKAAAEEVGAALVQREINAAVISGDVPQAERERVVARLRSGQLNVLVATDVAARGLDVDRIGLVVNFDLPHDAEVYVHRVGRTGRAGRAGTAVSFVTPKEVGRLRRIEKATRVPLAELPIPTPAEVSAHRLARLLDRVPDRLAAGRLDIARQVVEDYLAAQPADSQADPSDSQTVRLEQVVDLAAALAALAVGDTGPATLVDPLDADLAELTDDRRRAAPDTAPNDRGKGHRRDKTTRDDQPGGDRAARGGQPGGDRAARGGQSDEDRGGGRVWRDGERAPGGKGFNHRSSRSNAGPTRYWVGVGHRDHVKPGAIIAALTQDGDLRGHDLGRIDMYANYSIVETLTELPQPTLRRLAKARLAGRPLRLRLDTGQPTPPGLRPHKHHHRDARSR